jgi:hypothetical protein
MHRPGDRLQVAPGGLLRQAHPTAAARARCACRLRFCLGAEPVGEHLQNHRLARLGALLLDVVEGVQAPGPVHHPLVQRSGLLQKRLTARGRGFLLGHRKVLS